MSENSTITPNFTERLRRGALWTLFAVILMIPRMLGLRRHPRRWNALRVIVGLLGAAMFAADFAGHGGSALAVCGAFLVLLALGISPERRKPSVDQRARELGALVVVSGGSYRCASGSLVPARLFVGPDRLWALDTALRTQIELPLADLDVACVEAEDRTWKLELTRGGESAEFLYSGQFAEHLARVAESTLRSQLRRELPVLP